MSKLNEKTLTLGISSRALFDLDDSHTIYEKQGVEAYRQYQIAHEEDVLLPGPAFHLVKKLLALNVSSKDPLVEVILLSRNSSDTGLRVFNAIEHYQLPITRAAFTSGNNPHRYLEAFNIHLFLSVHPEDVCAALDAGYAAAMLWPVVKTQGHQELRIAFDGDAVLFSDESERIFKEQNLDAFVENEKKSARLPLPGGPFKSFLATLHRIQKLYPQESAPIRTALVTARSAPAHERVIRTLRAWDIRIDEAIFLGGLDKGKFLQAFGADIFFDDQRGHCDSASQHVATGHVLHGVSNQT